MLIITTGIVDVWWEGRDVIYIQYVATIIAYWTPNILSSDLDHYYNKTLLVQSTLYTLWN